MEAWLTPLTDTSLAEWVRLSRWGYAGINTLHVLGMALLIGSIVALDLRLLGLRRHLSLGEATKLLRPLAVAGLCLALVSGALLFLADPLGYASRPLFLLKMSLIVLGIASALELTLGPGIEHASHRRRQFAGALSLLVWPAVLVAGRLLAFVD